MENTHSGLGIASFAISIFLMVSLFILIMTAGAMDAKGYNEESPAAVLVGIGIIGCVFFNLITLGLGIANLFQSNKKKLFGVLGIVFSLLTIISVGALLTIGLTI